MSHLEAVAAGDQTAFAELYALTSAKLYGVVLRILRRRDWSDEALQEVYLRIWSRAASYRREKGTPMTWMITIARNYALDQVRGGTRERPVDPTDNSADWIETGPDALDLAIADDRARVLQACLDELDENQRRCIVLAYMDGLTHTELAARIGSPVGTVKSWIRRGQMRLKDCLER